MVKLLDRLIAWHKDRRQFAALRRRTAGWDFDKLELAARMEAITPQEFHRLCGNEDWRSYSAVPFSRSSLAREMQKTRDMMRALQARDE